MAKSEGRYNPLGYEFWTSLEAGLFGLFFVQSLRFLLATLYSRVASASLVALYDPSTLSPLLPGVVAPGIVSRELTWLGVIIGVPLLALVIGRIRFAFIGAAIALAVGRALLIVNDPVFTPTVAASIAVAGGLLYIALLVRNRLRAFPAFFILGFGIDQLFRAYGNTLDPSWSSNYLNIQIGLSVVGVLLCLLTTIPNWQKSTGRESTNDLQRGLLTIWGGLGLGALLFLQITLLALPNTIAGRADADYTLFVPLVLVATLLPLIPLVRRLARRFIIPFESGTRGWVWLVLIVLFLIVGIRLPVIEIRLPGAANAVGNFPIGAIALVIAQGLIGLVWWFIAEPQGERRWNLTGLWLMVAVLVGAVLLVGDLYTYEYAFVRNFAPPLDALNSLVPPLLRGFRGMGLGLVLIAAFLTLMPMVLSSQRVPWSAAGGRLASFALTVFVVGCALMAAYFARPPLIQPVLNVSELRIGTYNIHNGYSEFFAYDLENLVQTIKVSGVDVVMLQAVDAGRWTSYGVDQTLWLARRLGMDRRFFPTTEGLHGLAVLSKVPIVFDDGVIVPGVDRDTGLQRVQIRPDESALTLYNTSLGFLLQGSSVEEQESNQRDQLSVILGTIERHITQDYGGQLGRAILGGTFNNVPDSPLLQTLAKTGFIDPFAGSNLELTATLKRVDRSARFDYLWVWRLGLTPISSNVMDMPTEASDHRLAFVAVQIRQ